MNSKSLSRNRKSEIKGATVLGPADFPLGSLQSRAAIRSLLEKSVCKASAEVYPPGWSAKTAAQKAVLESAADILFFGGSAGSLKTETLLVDAATESGNPNLRAIIFRQSFPQMSDIIEKTQRLYGSMGARFVGQPTWTWTFPSGGKVRLAYIANDPDIFDYLGPRYSFIGFDESTLHTEYQVRNMLGRLSSTDHSLRLRMRLGSNPGNIGAGWHKAMFLRGVCPVHAPDRAPEAGNLYWDAMWPSDGYPLQSADGQGFSVSFIPGRLTDHHLLDDKYIYRLRMMSGSLAPAMETGCWCELAGMYFSFLRADQVIDLAEVEEQWWENHVISLDFGFGKSSAAAGLFSITEPQPYYPAGRIFELGTLIEKRMEATEFARAVCERFLSPTIGGQRRRVVAVYLDPSNFKHIGTGPSVARQMQEVFAQYGDLSVIPASNDRIAGWQMLYRLLKSGQLVLTKCNRGKSLIFEALSTRMHHEKLSGDLQKVAGDELDDVADMVRYAMLTWFESSSKPPELAIQQKLEEYRANGMDDYSLNIHRFRMEREHRQTEEQPVYLGRRHGRIIRR